MSRRLILFVFLGVLALIPHIGRLPEAHRLLIPIVVAFLIWQKRASLPAVAFRPEWVGAVLLVASVALWLSGERYDPALLQSGAVILGAVGVGFWLVGVEGMRTLAFPAAFLIFILPWPELIRDSVGPLLQTSTTMGAAGLGHITGLHSHGQGYEILMPNFTLTVAPACSGEQALLALGAVCAIFAYYTRSGLAQRWMMFLIGVPLALVLNVVRVWIIMLAGTLLGWKIAMGFFHEYSAPVLFVLIIFGLQGLKTIIEHLSDSPASRGILMPTDSTPVLK